MSPFRKGQMVVCIADNEQAMYGDIGTVVTIRKMAMSRWNVLVLWHRTEETRWMSAKALRPHGDLVSNPNEG